MHKFGRNELIESRRNDEGCSTTNREILKKKSISVLKDVQSKVTVIHGQL